jgi:two-component system, NarL family, response regulator LiaR
MAVHTAGRRRVRRVRVLIADDSPDFREMLRKRLDHDDRFTVVAEAANGQEAVDLTVEHGPDVSVVDLGMPVMDGLEAIRHIRERCPGVKVVVLTGWEPEAAAADAIDEGALAYLEKGTAVSQILPVLAPLAPPEFEDVDEDDR